MIIDLVVIIMLVPCNGFLIILKNGKILKL